MPIKRTKRTISGMDAVKRALHAAANPQLFEK